MKRFATILGILALAACMAFAPPKPKVPSIAISMHVVAGTVWVKYTATAAGAPDSLRVTTLKSAPTPADTVQRTGPSASVSDSVGFPRPTFGATISGSVNARSYRRGLASLVTVKAWTYTEPADTAPPAPVTSVTVTPVSVTLTPGGTALLTATIRRS